MMIPLTDITDQPLLPPMQSWYHVTTSRQLKKGQITTATICNKEVVVYRTESGNVRAIDPHCPHLGAHFGHGGKIKGENIECPFHAWTFNDEGKLIDVPYSDTTPTSTRACLTQWHVREKHGLILVWFHPKGLEPSFEPDLPQDLIEGNWSKHTENTYQIEGYVQELVENLIDVGHFPKIHQYDKLPEVKEASVKDHIFRAHIHTVANRLRFFEIETSFIAEFVGCGFSAARVRIGKHWQLLVIAGSTPKRTGEVHTTFTIRYLKTGNWFHDMISRYLTRFFEDDFLNDVNIWANKTYVENPLLSKDDGPIHKVRKWAKNLEQSDRQQAA
ncbi:MAG: Rieske 2Fe-2S domain-containing protein [Cellvibrionales bacterium]|nr:Rieske 2Fe-2S domain-containing protein [Cellvibrionales bacterium]